MLSQKKTRIEEFIKSNPEYMNALLKEIRGDSPPSPTGDSYWDSVQKQVDQELLNKAIDDHFVG